MKRAEEITGVILAGGRSGRFGSDKAVALLHGKFLIQHVKDTLTGIFSNCLLITNTPEQYAFLNLPSIRDRYQDMGPLAGIHAALLHTANPWIFVLGCDMPMVPRELVTYLCSLTEENEFQAVIPWPETGPEPLCGLYHKTAFETIELRLKNNQTQLRELVNKLSARKVTEEEIFSVTRGSDVFFNINFRQDLERLS